MRSMVHQAAFATTARVGRSHYNDMFRLRIGLTIFSLLVLAGSCDERNGNNNTTSTTGELRITNPYYSGCLYQKRPGWDKLRVCSNRYDPPDAAERGLCRKPPFDYMEIRVGTGNWDSATAMGWITQIILSEILGVPSSIESGAYGSSRDFYDPQAAIDYDRSMGVAPLVTATDLPGHDCLSIIPTSEEDYQPCAHFMPEFWDYPKAAILDQKVEPPQGTGVLGLETWYVTKFTADEYPEFVSYHGLQKEENRQKLAEVFKRPTTWKDYCAFVSLDNCTTPDSVAKRAPGDETEEARMFLAGLYTGYFRYTEQNLCSLNPDCKGHIANYPCGWQSNMEANLYHLNIPLECNNGPNGTPSGYTADQLMEMWDAANATRSHLMMAWWEPEPLYQRYLGTDAEFQRVILKPYTRECDKARQAWRDECSANLTERVGSPEAACDNPMKPLRKLISAGLHNALNDVELPYATRSPAYAMLRLFQISDIQLGELFDLWQSEETPRDAVCTWAVNNYDFLMSNVPPSYPRVVNETYLAELGTVSICMGGMAILIVMLTSWLVLKKRLKPSIQFAQLDFLGLLLSGSFLVCVGSILLGVPASNATCLSSIWFVNLGYTLEFVPLIIKVAAINSMMEAARELRRVTITRKRLYGAVTFIGVCFTIFLACWTALDPPRQEAEYLLSDSTTEHGDHIVDRISYCSGGDSSAWQFAAVAWNCVLLLCASVLAFQSRNVVRHFNESRTLAFLIYSHFIFVLLRIATLLLSEKIGGSVQNYTQSLLFALDQMVACTIYFLPKLTASNNITAWDVSDFCSGLRNSRINNSDDIEQKGPEFRPSLNLIIKNGGRDPEGSENISNLSNSARNTSDNSRNTSSNSRDKSVAHNGMEVVVEESQGEDAADTTTKELP